MEYDHGLRNPSIVGFRLLLCVLLWFVAIC